MPSVFDQLRNKLKDLQSQASQSWNQAAKQPVGGLVGQALQNAPKLFSYQAPQVVLPQLPTPKLTVPYNLLKYAASYQQNLPRPERVKNDIASLARPVTSYLTGLSEFAAGKGERAERFKQSPLAQMSAEDLAMSFSPAGVTSKLPGILKPLAQEAKNFSRFDEFVKAVQPKITTQMGQTMEQTATGLKHIFDRFGNGPTYPKVNIDKTKMSGVLLEKSKAELEQLGKKFAGKMPGFEEVPDFSTVVGKKIGKLDILWTPDRLLKRIGLEPEMNALRQSYETYLDELPREINKITQWSKQPGIGPGSETSIFRWLDGKKVELNPGELKVAQEIKGYLRQWADRLKLPEEQRVSNYITRLFDRELITKEFPDELVKVLRENVPGSTYDPFTMKRLGKLGYKENVWDALSAYIKRGVRKVNMDRALESISKASDSLEDTQYRYVKNYLDKVNMRPSTLDSDIDVSIKQLIGYKLGQRPVNVITQKLRQSVFRGALGLNPLSAIRNLTQISNTYSKLGERWTVTGYANFIKNSLARSDELERVGVLRDNFVEDRTLSAVNKFWEKTDSVLFSFFNLAERINRGSAYYGSKARALAQGQTEEQAIQTAKKLVRDTQFQFSRIDTPAILSSDIAKTLFQFQSFNLKQLEFLKEMVQNKEFAGLTRYVMANMVIYFTIGKALGFEPKDMIPFSGVLTGDTKLGQTPAVKFAGDVIGTAFNAPDKYGQQPSLEDRIATFGKDLVPFIPGGVQAKRTLEGLSAYGQGASTTASGRTRFPIEQNTPNLLKSAVFGQYGAAPEGYFQNLGKSKSKIVLEKLNQFSPEEQNSMMLELQKGDPSLFADVRRLKLDEIQKVTSSEKKIRNLPVRSGDKAKAIVRKLKGKTPEEQNEIVQRYIEAGIISEDVLAQLKRAKAAGVL